MKKLMIAVGAVLAGAMAMASTPASFAYQGVLRDDGGRANVGSSAKITFRLYNDPTKDPVLWSQTQTVSLDTNGLFNAELSDPTNGLAAVIATNESAGKPLYIGLTVEGSAGEIRPRQKLIAAPLAAFAQDVHEAKGDFTVNGTTYFNGPVSMTDTNQTLTSSSIDAKGTLTASGKATFNGGAQVGGNMTVSGQASVDSLTVAKGVTVSSGNIKVSSGNIELDAGKTVTANGVNIGVPIGCILMWSGAVNEIPDGWALCNGQTMDDGTKTPDLRGRFIVGAGTSENDYVKDTSTGVDRGYAVDAKGGKNEVALTKSQMPNHSHAYLGDDHPMYNDNCPLSRGLDSKKLNSGWMADLPGSDVAYNFDSDSDDDKYGRRWMTGTAGGDATDKDVGYDGYADTHENRPPYYALCFIMKVK